MAFAGFSQADILKMSRQTTSAPNGVLNRDLNRNSHTQSIRRKPTTTKLTDSSTTDANANKDIKKEANERTTTFIENPKMEEAKSEKKNENNHNENGHAETSLTEKQIENTAAITLIDAHEFEAKQKIMEEQNRKRKELLAKALADRTQQTLEETQRLNLIKEEFKTLDAMSNDVKILRKRIEDASIEYTECQKKYDKVEKEFLQAKFLLHQKQEKKEMLTQHLYTIINTNEERKADKLTELMQKLHIDDGNKADEAEDKNTEEK